MDTEQSLLIWKAVACTSLALLALLAGIIVWLLVKQRCKSKKGSQIKISLEEDGAQFVKPGRILETAEYAMHSDVKMRLGQNVFLPYLCTNSLLPKLESCKLDPFDYSKVVVVYILPSDCMVHEMSREVYERDYDIITNALTRRSGMQNNAKQLDSTVRAGSKVNASILYIKGFSNFGLWTNQIESCKSAKKRISHEMRQIYVSIVMQLYGGVLESSNAETMNVSEVATGESNESTIVYIPIMRVLNPDQYIGWESETQAAEEILGELLSISADGKMIFNCVSEVKEVQIMGPTREITDSVNAEIRRRIQERVRCESGVQPQNLSAPISAVAVQMDEKSAHTG